MEPPSGIETKIFFQRKNSENEWKNFLKCLKTENNSSDKVDVYDLDDGNFGNSNQIHNSVDTKFLNNCGLTGEMENFTNTDQEFELCVNDNYNSGPLPHGLVATAANREFFAKINNGNTENDPVLLNPNISLDQDEFMRYQNYGVIDNYNSGSEPGNWNFEESDENFEFLKSKPFPPKLSACEIKQKGFSRSFKSNDTLNFRNKGDYCFKSNIIDTESELSIDEELAPKGWTRKLQKSRPPNGEGCQPEKVTLIDKHFDS